MHNKGLKKNAANLAISHMMQRDTTDLTTENKELKLRLEALEQEAQLREGMHHFIFVYSLKNGHVLSPLSAISYWIGQINKVVQSLHLYVAWNIISWIFMCQFLPFPKLCMKELGNPNACFSKQQNTFKSRKKYCLKFVKLQIFHLLVSNLNTWISINMATICDCRSQWGIEGRTAAP